MSHLNSVLYKTIPQMLSIGHSPINRSQLIQSLHVHIDPCIDMLRGLSDNLVPVHTMRDVRVYLVRFWHIYNVIRQGSRPIQIDGETI